jgi:hypothetical protein
VAVGENASGRKRKLAPGLCRDLRMAGKERKDRKKDKEKNLTQRRKGAKVKPIQNSREKAQKTQKGEENPNHRFYAP